MGKRSTWLRVFFFFFLFGRLQLIGIKGRGRELSLLYVKGHSKSVCYSRVVVCNVAFHPFTDQLYVAIDWDPDMKKKYYNDTEAEVCSSTV